MWQHGIKISRFLVHCVEIMDVLIADTCPSTISGLKLLSMHYYSPLQPPFTHSTTPHLANVALIPAPLDFLHWLQPPEPSISPVSNKRMRHQVSRILNHSIFPVDFYTSTAPPPPHTHTTPLLPKKKKRERRRRRCPPQIWNSNEQEGRGVNLSINPTSNGEKIDWIHPQNVWPWTLVEQN